MFKSCIFLLLVATCSVHSYVTSNSLENETASSNFSIEMGTTSKAKYNSSRYDGSPKVLTKKPLDCVDVLEMGHNKSGVYKIWPANRMFEGKHLYVYCDMEVDGQYVIQRRGDFQTPKHYFYRDWMNYKEGFGELEQDFWLGNDNIFALTNQKLYSVRFDLKDFQGNERYAHYSNFWIEDEERNYTLRITIYAGNAGDSMAWHNNGRFSTKDRDTCGKCAEKYKGGWWFKGGWPYISDVNLNGLYHKGKPATNDGIFWLKWKPYSEPLAWTEMKIRPKNFRQSLSSEGALD